MLHCIDAAKPFKIIIEITFESEFKLDKTGIYKKKWR